jgi:hypothetical protein
VDILELLLLRSSAEVFAELKACALVAVRAALSWDALLLLLDFAD